LLRYLKKIFYNSVAELRIISFVVLCHMFTNYSEQSNKLSS
jgi:hypothetical protein